MDQRQAEALVLRMAEEDQSALAQLYDGYSSLVNGLALRILRDPAEAEDVVQEVFVQAWRQAARFDAGRGNASAWLCTIARTRALDRVRRRSARREDPVESAPVPAATPRPAETLAVRAALAALPEDQRQAVELACYEGLTHVEIAERLGQPLGTVKTRIRTAMIRLRGALESRPA